MACWQFRLSSGVIDLVRPTVGETEASQGVLSGLVYPVFVGRTLMDCLQCFFDFVDNV